MANGSRGEMMSVMEFSHYTQTENQPRFHWVRRELHDCFDFIMHDPPPDEILALLEGADSLRS